MIKYINIYMLFFAIILLILLVLYGIKNREGFQMNYNTPIYLKEYNIFDIYFNNEKLILISNCGNALNIVYNGTKLNYIECPHKHSSIYSLKTTYNENIDLIINDVKINTKVNKYPEFKDEIIMSTIVKDEDNYIIQWINYHSKLGITRFIIYDNSDKNTLPNTLREYISNDTVLLIKWPYDYTKLHAQQTQQNHSLYAFKTSKYIGFFDIDEYINIQSQQTIPQFLENIIHKNSINTNTIGSFRILNKFFYNPDNKDTSGTNFLHIFNCDEITKNEREKNFVIPKNVNTFSVHMITDGLQMYTLDETDIYFNHYVYLNKPSRGNIATGLKDDSIIIHI